DARSDHARWCTERGDQRSDRLGRQRNQYVILLRGNSHRIASPTRNRAAARTHIGHRLFAGTRGRKSASAFPLCRQTYQAGSPWLQRRYRPSDGRRVGRSSVVRGRAGRLTDEFRKSLCYGLWAGGGFLESGILRPFLIRAVGSHVETGELNVAGGRLSLPDVPPERRPMVV